MSAFIPNPHRSLKKMIMRRRDFLSDLSDDMIHNIMFFLVTKDAIKFTVLSKRFRFLFYSSPSIHYDIYEFLRPRKLFHTHDLLNSLNQSIIYRSVESRSMLDLDKFTFRTTMPSTSPDERVESGNNIVNSAIVFALHHNVKEFDFCYSVSQRLVYVIPIDVFSSKSIRVLKLKYSEIHSSILNSMKKLEVLDLVCCKLPVAFKILGSNIKSVNLMVNIHCKEIDIEAPRLESLCFYAPFSGCDVSFMGCKYLRYLELFIRNISEEWLASHLVGFPFLEVLKIYSCIRLRNIYLNDKLKTIDLHSFELKIFNKGTSMESFNLDMRTCRHLKNLILHEVNITESWFEDNMRELRFLEVLKIYSCRSLRNLYMSDATHSKLQTVNLQFLELKNIGISISNLETFIYTTNSNDSCDIDIIDCTHLKFLTLSGVTIEDSSWLEDNGFPFPFLEKLTLDQCRFVKKTKVHFNHSRLKDLSLCS